MNEIVEFPIHFNVLEHHLRADDFIAFSVDLKKIITEFNNKLFLDSTCVEIYILPPEPGTFLGKWGISFAVTSVSMGSIFMALDTDISKQFIYGLTGHKPAYYAEMVGSEIKNGTILLSDVVRGFLEKDEKSEELKDIKLENFPDSYLAKNDFYKKCLANQEISAIGFTCEDKFPIKRDAFAHKIANLIDGDLELEPEYAIHQLRIISSVNTIDSKAQWQLQDVQTRLFLKAHLKDEDFRRSFLSGKYPLKFSETDDIIIAMIEYKKAIIEGVVKITERNIIRIYKFNRFMFDDVPKHMAISSVSRIKSGASERQLSFLDSLSKD